MSSRFALSAVVRSIHPLLPALSISLRPADVCGNRLHINVCLHHIAAVEVADNADFVVRSVRRTTKIVRPTSAGSIVEC